MKVLFNFSLALLTSAVFVQQIAIAQESHNERIQKVFAVKKNVTVEITNKHGKVQISSWNKDSVQFQINFNATAKTVEKLDKLVESIDFDFTNSGSYVVATTVYGSASSLNADLIRIRNAVSTGGNNDVTINYKVKVPSYATLKISNKFGDIYIDERSRPTTIDLSHGDLKSTHFRENLDLKLSFGDADIQTVTSAQLNLNHSKNFSLETSKQLSVTSKYSKMNLGDIGSLRLDSRKDEIHITKVNELSGKCTLPDLLIFELLKNLTLKSQHIGSVTIEQIDHNFEFIDLKTNYTDINLNFNSGAGYDFNMTHKNVDFDKPISSKGLTTINLEEEKKLQQTTGHLGAISKKAVVKIEAESCTIHINHK